MKQRSKVLNMAFDHEMVYIVENSTPKSVLLSQIPIDLLVYDKHNANYFTPLHKETKQGGWCNETVKQNGLPSKHMRETPTSNNT